MSSAASRGLVAQKPNPLGSLFTRRARRSWSQGVLLSGTVLDWGDAYAGVSSQVQLGAPMPPAGLFVWWVRGGFQGVLLLGTVLDWGDAYAGVSSQVQLGDPMPPAVLFVWWARGWFQGVLLSGTVLDWGDAYAGVSSRVQLGAPNPSQVQLGDPNSSRVQVGAAMPPAGLFGWWARGCSQGGAAFRDRA